MRARWLAFAAAVGPILLACSHVDSASVSKRQPPTPSPRASTATPPAPSVAPLSSQNPNTLRKPDVPLPLPAYRNEKPRVGKPGALAFVVRGGHGGMGASGAPTRDLLIEVSGGVWRSLVWADRREDTRVGHVTPQELASMRRLASDISKSAAHTVGSGCFDCSGAVYIAYGVNGASKDGDVLAAWGETSSASDSASVQKAVLWLQAVGTRALRVPRKSAFDLELPILSELTDDLGGGEPNPGVTVLELGHNDSDWSEGVRVASDGKVYRFRETRKQIETLSYVGHVENGALQRVLTAARACRQAHWQDLAGKSRLPTALRFFADSSSPPLLISNDQAGAGGRLVGKNSDLVIAWVYALDEQALDPRALLASHP
jgi:hypothetical protein